MVNLVASDKSANKSIDTRKYELFRSTDLRLKKNLNAKPRILTTQQC